MSVGDVKKPNVLHHPMQAKNLPFNPYIYFLYYQSNVPYNLTPSPACYPSKKIYFICNEGGIASLRNCCTQRHNNKLKGTATLMISLFYQKKTMNHEF